MGLGLFRLALVIWAVVGVSSCKIVSSVPENGKITWRDGLDYCLAGQTCTTETPDSTFNEIFVAVPSPGHAFTGWKRGGWCGGWDQPCWLSTSGFDENESLLAWLESDEETLLTPQFSPIVQTVACSDPSVPGSFSDLLDDEWGYLRGLDLNMCRYAPGDADSPIEAIAFFEYGDDSVPLDFTYYLGSQRIQQGVLGPGDLLIAVSFSDGLGLSPDDTAIVLSVDSDRDPNTGKGSFSVIGADYRATGSFCIKPVPEGFPLPPGVDEAGIPSPGFLEVWSEADDKWMPVPDETFGNKISFPSVSGGWFIYIFTGFGSEGIGIPELIGAHIEQLGENCARQPRTNIEKFIGVYDN